MKQEKLHSVSFFYILINSINNTFHQSLTPMQPKHAAVISPTPLNLK